MIYWVQEHGILSDDLDQVTELERESEMDEKTQEEVMDEKEAAGEEDALAELEKENERLRRENELLKEYRASLPVKERLYDRIPLTVKQMDMIIGILLGLLAVVIVLGLIDR